MTALGDFTSGEILTAADLNAIGTWTSFTPTWTFGANAITTNVNQGRYVIVNEIVIVKVNMRYASKAGSGALTVTVPSACSITPLAAFDRLGSGSMYDNNLATSYNLTPYHDNFSTTSFGFLHEGGAIVTDTVPFVWNTNDEIGATLIGVKA